MTIELKMLVLVSLLSIVMWLPYVLVRIKTYGYLKALTYSVDDSPIADWAIRAKKAHYNAVENLIVFSVLIIVAHLVKVSNDGTVYAAIGYFWFRLAHYLLYISGIPFGRTLAFAGAWLSQICIAYQILAATFL